MTVILECGITIYEYFQGILYSLISSDIFLNKLS